MKIIYLLFIVLLLQGCQTIYIHPSKTQEDFARDKYECEQIATQYSANYNAQGNPFIIAGEIKRCLEQKFGWQRCPNCKK